MKKTAFIISVLAMIVATASCQRVDIDNNAEVSSTPLKVKAYIDGKIETRMTYTADNTANTITPAWQGGEAIIGFDDLGQKFTFTVTRADSESEAELSTTGYVPGSATTVYAIFYPGKTVDDFTADGDIWKLPVDLASQGGVLNANLPAIMCATGTIANNEVELHFTNQTAIIGVKKFQLNGVSAVTEVTGLTLNGVITEGTFEVDQTTGNLVLTPGTTTGHINATGSWNTDAAGICEEAVYFAAMPTDDANLMLNATVGTTTYANVSNIPQSTIAAGNYYYMSKKLGGAVADVDGIAYPSIDTAWTVANAATAPCTVTLLDDCTSARMLSLNSAASGTGAVTLDLNGQTLTVTPTGTKGIEIDGTRSLTVRDGASGGKIVSSAQYMVYATGTAPDSPIKQFILQSGSLNGTYTGSNNSTALHLITNNGLFEITGGSISATNTNYRGIYVGNNSILDVNNLTVNTSAYCVYLAIGTVNLNGGTFNRTGTYCVYTSNESSVANIFAGIYTHTSSGNPLIYASKGVINVTGGYFNSVNVRPVNCAGTSASDGVAYVTGGCFNKPLPNNVLTDAGSMVYTNVLNADDETNEVYPFSVANVSKVATTTQGDFTWDFGTIEGAMKGADLRAKANGHSTVTLTDDCTASSTMSVSEGNSYRVTLDLAGYDITSTASGSAITTASNFILTDSGATSGEINSTATALAVTAGTATVNGGSLYGQTNAATVASGASLVVNGGYIYGSGAADIANSGTTVVYGGYFNNNPSALCAASAAAASVTQSFNSRTYNYQVEAVVATVNGVGYPTLADAAAAAVAYNGGDATVTLQLQDDVTYNATLNLTHASKPVVFDLNGHTLSTSTYNLFNPSSGTLTITDSQDKVGKITTSSYQAVYAGGSGSTTITISNCIIEGTMRKASGSGDEMLMLAGGTSNTTISGARIYTNGVQTVLKLNNSNCNVTINDSEMSSGIDTTASYFVVAHNNGNLTVNSGSFYSKNNSVIQHTGTNNTKKMNTTINGGYFYSGDGAAYCLRANLSGDKGMILNGGYMNIEPSGSKVSYGPGVSLQACDEYHTHATIGVSLHYTKKVAPTP
ncbi:MAG: hypothetical protein J5699_07075 [Bacteroidales bacterium]|nr:hypothetical protein [Bacteroidales bacterium]